MKKKKVFIFVLLILIAVFSLTTVYAKETANVGDNICKEVESIRVLKTAGAIITIFKFMAPVIIIIYSTFKFAKSITSQEGKEYTKAIRDLIFRVVAGIMLFFLPTIVNAVLSFTNYYSDTNDCYKCLFDTAACDMGDTGNSGVDGQLSDDQIDVDKAK